ncbi:hypothetical protein CEE37_11455 [candidate division LCP-89 bacterium B3_LCP]|uniref:Response regulatory domain-containing protein n=1 Tax=candidate division LCP-89 bacterium B3_LCP TaxID=2012998 RepID=A0A532UVS5_UNCL8|nr:MAG: hypothetical protein CEE37_11455 [candidate division LCP-89 bacterium B3_LCP]
MGSNNGGHIYFIDDDIIDMEFAISLLKDDGIEVTSHGFLADAFPFLRSDNAKDIDVFVADFAIAYGQVDKDQPKEDTFTAGETGNGRYTGARLLRAIRNGERNINVNRSVPAIFYTNLRLDPEIHRLAEELKAKVCLKLEGGYSELYQLITGFLREKEDKSE